MKYRHALVVSLFVVATIGLATAGTADAARPVSADQIPAMSATSQSNQTPPDPATDVIGWENGYWHNESIDVNQSDGLSEAERSAFVARSMARVEELRQREFKTSVPIKVMPRSEYLTLNETFPISGTPPAWKNQLWEALFLIEEDRNATTTLRNIYKEIVSGSYSWTTESIVIVTENPDTPTIDNATLVHELTHALQDQYHNLSRFVVPTHDKQLAYLGLVEGEATYIQRRYALKCSQGEWDCVRAPPASGGEDINVGIRILNFQPYSDGAVYVGSVVQNRGWENVTDLYENPPDTTEAIVHNHHLSTEPVSASFADSARNGWTRLPGHGMEEGDRIGEASIFTMFWYQSYPRGYVISIIPYRNLLNTDAEFDVYNYSSGPSSGWGSDRFVPYHKKGEYGYVWKTVWDTKGDATRFHEAYLQLLNGHGAEQYGNRTWVIPDGPFADAFHVHEEGRNVTIVNAPTVENLSDIRPEISLRTPTPTRTPSPTQTPSPATPGLPGFGIVVSVIVVLCAAVLEAWRRP